MLYVGASYLNANATFHARTKYIEMDIFIF